VGASPGRVGYKSIGDHDLEKGGKGHRGVLFSCKKSKSIAENRVGVTSVSTGG